MTRLLRDRERLAPEDPATGLAGRRLTLVFDPRFPGGTSTSIAAEIRAIGRHVRLSAVALETAMFKGRHVHPEIAAALDDLGLALDWNPPVVHADTLVFHNPSCLRFDTAPPVRLSCARAFVVTHENFLRPNGSESHDVAGCLDRLEAALTCGARWLAPVSPHNRSTVEAWLAAHGRRWAVAPTDWTTVLDPVLRPPNPAPRDRRGRHSRPGLEKFPSRAAMLAHFPPRAERCAILGADAWLADPATLPAHWEALRFGEVDVADFLAGIDFHVYFTNPNWRESYGRVVAEAIAAGKVVITDPGTAASFGGAVVASDGTDVDRIVAGFVANPDAYGAFVSAAQAGLGDHGPAAFRARLAALLAVSEAADALV